MICVMCTDSCGYYFRAVSNLVVTREDIETKQLSSIRQLKVSPRYLLSKEEVLCVKILKTLFMLPETSLMGRLFITCLRDSKSKNPNCEVKH